LFADQLALGTPGSGFGLKQLSGTLIGLLIAAAGIAVLKYFPPIEDEHADDDDRGEQLT
jgi:hypothetical protein